MEILIAYKQSKTIDKSLSYLSGVGEDLSFDISYFIRLSKCSTRYFEEPIFLSYRKSIFSTDKIDFGKLLPSYAAETSYDGFMDQQRKMPININTIIISASRYRETLVALEETFQFLDIKKRLDIRNDFLYAEMLRKKGLYSSNHIYLYRTSYGMLKNYERFFEASDRHSIPNHQVPLFAHIPVPSLDVYDSDGEVAGTSSHSLNENQIVAGIKSHIRDTNLNSMVEAEGYVKSAFSDDFAFTSTQTTTVHIEKFKFGNISHPEMDIDELQGNLSTRSTTATINEYEANYGIPLKGSYIPKETTASTPLKGVLSNDKLQWAYSDLPGITGNDDLHISTPRKGIYANDSIFTNKFRTGIDGFSDMYFVGQESKSIFEEYTDVHFGLSSKKINTEYTTVAIGDVAIGANIPDLIDSQASVDAPSLYDIDSNAFFLSKHRKGMVEAEQYQYLSKHSKEAYGEETYGYLSKYNHKSRVADVDFIGKGDKEKFELETTSVGKSDKSYFEIDHEFISRLINKGLFDCDALRASKNAIEISQSQEDISILKDHKGILDSDHTFLNKVIEKGIYGDDGDGVSKNLKSITSNELCDFIYRNARYPHHIFDTDEYLFKSIKSVSNPDTSIIANKSQYAISIETTDKFFKKNPIATRVNDLYVRIDKNPYNTNIIKVYTTVTKSLINTSITDDSPFINKNYKPTELESIINSVWKEAYNTDEKQTHIFYTVPDRNHRMFPEEVFAKKNEKPTTTNRWIVNVKPAYRPISTVELMTHFQRIYDFRYEESIWIYLPTFSKVMTDDVIPVEVKDHIKVDIDTDIIASKPTRNAALDRGSGFGYVEKTDYAKIKDDRIDELFLPASDFNYDSFASKLVVDGNVDIRYIKRIDENGNIYVNIPVENPIKHYSDLATQYIDLNVGMLTYIIEKAYNIWQNNIFVYSAMSSDGALNDILKKLKQNLFIQYPSEEDQYHLHRAIRLFRWYSEMSILNNAEYMLKLIYEDIAIDYANRDLSPFSDIATFENLAINTSYVLVPIDVTKPSKFTIHVDRSHKVRLSFLAAVTGGHLVINDNINIDTYTEEMVQFDRELDIGENTLTFEFTPTASNAYFGVMQLKVSNYNITSYDVEYVGKIGESNPTINHLITMLSVCGDSIDTIQKMVAHASPQTNALEQMRVYFDLHHEEKLKGKRLTTKK